MTKKFIWGVMALSVVIAVIILGSGSGGNANINGGVNTNVLLPGLLTIRLSKLRW